jgi:hypothetical protein
VGAIIGGLTNPAVTRRIGMLPSRQQIVPAELLGRVNSVYRMIGWGLIPVGAVAGGLVAKEFGLRAPYTLGGIVIAVIGAATVPVLLRARRLRPAGYGLQIAACWLRLAVAAAVIELAAGQSGPAERDDDRDDQPGRGQRHREPGRLRGYFSGRRAWR